MSTGTQVNVISAQLTELLDRIRQETLNVVGRAKRPNPADPAAAVYFGRLDAWKYRLEDLQRQLKQLRSNVDAQRTLVPTVSRGATVEIRRSATYRATQSLDAKTAHIRDAQDIAERVSDALADLLLLSITPTKTDVEKSVSDLANKPIDFFHKLEDLSKSIDQTERAGSLDQHSAGQLRSTVSQIRAHEQIGPSRAAASPDFVGVATLMLTLVRIVWLYRIRQEPDAPK